MQRLQSADVADEFSFHARQRNDKSTVVVCEWR